MDTRACWAIAFFGISVVADASSGKWRQETKATTSSRPMALEEFVRHRDLLRTAEFEITVTEHQAAEKKNRPVRPRFLSVIVANDRHVVVDRGDSEGVTIRTPTGEPHPDFGAEPRVMFFEAGTAILRQDDQPLRSAMLFRTEPEAVADFRSLGAAPTYPFANADSTIWQSFTKNPSVPRYEERSEGELRVIRCIWDNKTITYWIDPNRDWNAVRVRDESRGGDWSECRSELNKIDGVWFPRKSSIFNSRFHNGVVPTQTFDVADATFNQPDHAQNLTPASIGLEPGMDVTVIERGKANESGKWSGIEVISFQEYAEKAARGEVKDGPRFTAAFV